MKKSSVALGLFVVAFALFVQNDKIPLQIAAASQDDASKFIEHPTHCVHLLGYGLDGDVPPPSMHWDLEAALDSTSLPAVQAIGQISTFCRQRLAIHD